MNDAASESTTLWRKCSTCKKPISFGARYYVCSVSTCNGQRTGYVFCSVGCWESHVPGARHRDAAAVEKIAPSRETVVREAQAAQAQTGASSTSNAAGSLSGDAQAPKRVLASSGPARTTASASNLHPAVPQETLIVASRLKEFIDARSGGFNTSQSVIDALSAHVRSVCDRAIENARADGRKTVMDRDFEFLKRG